MKALLIIVAGIAIAELLRSQSSASLPSGAVNGVTSRQQTAVDAVPLTSNARPYNAGGAPVFEPRENFHSNFSSNPGYSGSQWASNQANQLANWVNSIPLGYPHITGVINVGGGGRGANVDPWSYGFLDAN
jgi:hypothetical protein